MDSKQTYQVDSEMNSKHSLDAPSHGANYDINEGNIEKQDGIRGIRAWLKKLSVETGGIQRVTDEERLQNPSKVWNACTFW